VGHIVAAARLQLVYIVIMSFRSVHHIAVATCTGVDLS